MGLTIGACIVGAVAALAYGLYFLKRPPSLVGGLVKALFIGAPTIALAASHAPLLLVVALAAAALGDFFLAFDKRWQLLLGILGFLIAQLGYLLIFSGLWILSGDNSPLWPRYVATALIVVLAVAAMVWMAPKLKWMALAVFPYAAATTAMACMAMWLPWAAWPAMLGAVAFVLSDLVLASELFYFAPDASERRFTKPFVWWSYVAAQVLIVSGLLLAFMARV